MIAAGGVVIAERCAAHRHDRRVCHAGRRQRQPAGSARPRRHCGVGGQRLLVGQHEAEPGARGDGRRSRNRSSASSGSASGRRPARRMSTASSANGAVSRTAPGRGRMIYLDYQATTPVAPEVAEAMRPWIEESSPIRIRRRAGGARRRPRSRSRATRSSGDRPQRRRRRLHRKRDRGAQLGAQGDGREAPKGRNRIVTVATEHAAVLDSCEWLAGRGIDSPCFRSGRTAVLDIDLLERELDKRVALVAVMLVNNEIGVIQPVAEIADMAHGAGALMLCDAVQGFGRVDLSKGPDLVAISAHKIHGPKGIGALVDARRVPSRRRSFTAAGRSRDFAREPCRQRCASASAQPPSSLRSAPTATMTMSSDCGAPRSRLWDRAGSSTAASTTAIKGNLNIRREGVDAARLLADLRDIAFSLGSACASGSGRPSHVLRALGLDYREAARRSALGSAATPSSMSWSTRASASPRSLMRRRSSTRERHTRGADSLEIAGIDRR